jgi:hypothetical protein
VLIGFLSAWAKVKIIHSYLQRFFFGKCSQATVYLLPLAAAILEQCICGHKKSPAKNRTFLRMNLF